MSLINFINNLHVYNIVGDQAYRGYEKIVIPGLSENVNIRNYSTELGKQRIIVENAFGLFKGKFKGFYFKSYNGSSEKFSKLFIASVVIHNLLIDG